MRTLYICTPRYETLHVLYVQACVSTCWHICSCCDDGCRYHTRAHPIWMNNCLSGC